VTSLISQAHSHGLLISLSHTFPTFYLAFVCRGAADHALPCPSLREFRVSPRFFGCPVLTHVTYVIGCVDLNVESIWIIEFERFF
jgi:hypothetical protein